jgi:signal transduction histidine kinase
MLKNSPVSDPKRDFIESIVSETRQLEGVLDEILNYSDSLYPTRDFWDVNQAVESAIRDVQDMLLQRGCECRFDPDKSLPQAYIDFKQISYCIRTLIINDIEGRSGIIFTISLSGTDGFIEISVVDKGRRVSQEELDLLLTPFAITHDMGTGIGLALCRTMLEKQGIPLVVTAPPDGGITYSIKLPTRKEEPFHEQITGS